MSKRFLNFQKSFMGTGVFSIVYLDDYRDQVTFKARRSPAAAGGDVAAAKSNKEPGKNRAAGGAKNAAAGKRKAVPQTSPKKPAEKAHHVAAAGAGPAPAASDEDLDDWVLPSPPPAAAGAASNEASAESEHEEEADESKFFCPITLNVYLMPVQTPYGHIFELDALLRSLAESPTCPTTRQPLQHSDLKPAPREFRERLQAYRRRKGLPA
jgi:hypothetical protein